MTTTPTSSEITTTLAVLEWLDQDYDGRLVRGVIELLRDRWFEEDDGCPNDDAFPCKHDGCTLPGRFAIGTDQGAMRYWCLHHVPDGCAYIGELARALREAIRHG